MFKRENPLHVALDGRLVKDQGSKVQPEPSIPFRTKEFVQLDKGELAQSLGYHFEGRLMTLKDVSRFWSIAHRPSGDKGMLQKVSCSDQRLQGFEPVLKVIFREKPQLLGDLCRG